MKKVIIVIAIFLFSQTSFVFADWMDPYFRFTQFSRIDKRGDTEDLTGMRLSGTFAYKLEDSDMMFQITPFIEGRIQKHDNDWVREEAGIEFGVNLLKWLYWGEGFQHAWLYGTDDTPEIESRFVLKNKLCTLADRDIGWFILEEHTYNLDIGEGTRNESGFGFIIPVFENVESKVNWRHIDRIHDSDFDTFELSVGIVF